MTQQRTSQEAHYLASFDTFQRNGVAAHPSWVQELRKGALATFKATGFPTARRGNEAFKYTDINPLARSTFALAGKPNIAGITAHKLDQITVDKPRSARLVFVDGIYVKRMSTIENLASGVVIADLAEALERHPALVQEHLGKIAAVTDSAFTALNTAFLHHGAFVHIPNDAIVQDPILLVFISSSGEQATVSHPRVLIVAGRHSKAAVVEQYVAIGSGKTFTNAVTEIVVGERSHIEHYRIQHEGAQTYHIGATHAVQKRDSALYTFHLDIGAQLARNALNVLLAEEGGACSLNGLYLPANGQHMDTQTFIDHATSYTNSNELYKGILAGRSHGVFGGRVLVRHGIRQIDAHQLNKNLLMSERAEMDTKPQLEIFADDVKCTHGAAVGQIDPNMLFYLKARGLDEQAAKGLLTYGFVSEVLDTIKQPGLHTQLSIMVSDRLHRLES